MEHGEVKTVTRVLVVDDDDAQRDVITKVLRRAGYAVMGVRSGADAMEAGRATRPDLAVLDVFLADSGGLGLAEALRAEAPELRVLYVTGLTLPSVRDALAPAPVLFKPFRRQELLASLRALAMRA